MYIIIPFFLILFSALGVLFIIWRKTPALSESISQGQSLNEGVSGVRSVAWKDLFHDFFPEANKGIEKMELKEHAAVWLLEVEKFLRKTRLLFLKIDRLSETLIKKIRRFHLSNRPNKDVLASSPIIKEDATSSYMGVKKKEESSQLDTLKKEEQRLILEIAKNPKDPNLYHVLGDLYFKMNNFEDARESYQAAMELSPGNEELAKKHSQAVEKMIK